MMYSYCIIGGGPAGLVLAQALLRKTPANEIILIEAGGLNELNEQAAEFISVGKTEYKPYRQFRLGGHSHIWGGACPRLHPNDFKMRTLYGQYADWPLEYDELVPYYERAEKLLKVERVTNKNIESADPYVKAVKHKGLSGSLPYGDRNYFVSELVPQIVNSGIKLMLNCVVRRIESLPTSGGRVHFFNEGLKKTEYVDANKVILCTGGLSNARILQMSLSEIFSDNAKNLLPALGKYFMDHPRVTLDIEKNSTVINKPILKEGL